MILDQISEVEKVGRCDMVTGADPGGGGGGGAHGVKS